MIDPAKFLKESVIETVEKTAKNFDGENPQITFVMGDLHGMDHFLHKMFKVLMSKYSTPIAANFVFLGDYVDRGPGSAQVITMIRYLQELMPKDRVVALRGNHEEMLLDGLRYGGQQKFVGPTAKSFNFEPIPKDYIEWMYFLPYMHEDENHYYVHAGFDPRLNVKDQTREEMLWIREKFLFSKKNWGKHVFHGHTCNTQLGIKLNRTNLDTGACFEDGYLTCAVVKPEFQRAITFIQVDNKKTYFIYKEAE